MNLRRRQEYLKAMGIEVWQSRSAAAAGVDDGRAREDLAEGLQPKDATTADSMPAARFGVGPGSGKTLLVCARSEEAATALAADIARSLEGEPVWAWPAAGTKEPGVTLAAAIAEHMFDRVLIFGSGQAVGVAAGEDGIAAAAQLIRAEPIAVLMESGDARRGLWQQLSASGWSARWAATA